MTADPAALLDPNQRRTLVALQGDIAALKTDIDTYIRVTTDQAGEIVALERDNARLCREIACLRAALASASACARDVGIPWQGRPAASG